MLAEQDTKFELQIATRIEEEMQLGFAVDAIETQITELKVKMQTVARMLLPLTGSDPIPSSECDGGDGACVPSVAAEGVDLMFSAASGDVSFVAKECGSVSLCSMSKRVAILASLLADMGNFADE
jgi:hypothetical protein